MTPAEALLQELGITEPEEIDLEAISYHVGAKIRFRPLCGCEAHILGCGGQAIITVKHDSSARRKRFSIAHELGHWRFHRGKTLVCRVDESGLPYGGAKGGIAVDPLALSRRELETLSRRYMQEMIPFVGPYTDVMAPDLGTDEQVMAWFMDTYSMYQGRTVTEIVTGKPIAAGGTHGRRDATGNGVAYLAGRAMEKLTIDPRSATAVVQGFGNVGSVSAVALAKQGVRIIGISDHSVALHDSRGFDLEAVLRHVRQAGILKGFAQQAEIDQQTLLTLKCDVLVPAAIERVIDQSNAADLQCRIIAEGANGPTTPDADEIIEARGDIFVVPDILCNAGGVIVSYFEWVQDLQRLLWDELEVTRRLYEILDRSFTQVVARAERLGISNGNAALSIGVQRVRDVKGARGLFP